jgi:hypothetical protein
MITRVKVWTGRESETRIYVTADDGRQGCKYLTGNHFQARGTIDGQLTEAEWNEAKSLALVDSSKTPGKKIWSNYEMPKFTKRSNRISRDEEMQEQYDAKKFAEQHLTSNRTGSF